MTVYDSSVLIDYLAGEARAVDYVKSHSDQRAVAPPLVLFEVYRGELYKSGPPDFDAVDAALQWLDTVTENRSQARAAANAQHELQTHGVQLSARDAFIAGIAIQLDETLAVADTDFALDGIDDVLAVDLL